MARLQLSILFTLLSDDIGICSRRAGEQLDWDARMNRALLSALRLGKEDRGALRTTGRPREEEEEKIEVGQLQHEGLGKSHTRGEFRVQ